MVKDLLKRNFRTGVLPKIPKKYLSHWLRGYFDGDGSIYLEQKSNRLKSSFVFGIKELAFTISNYLKEEGIKCSNVHIKTNSQNCWYIQLGPNQTKKLMDLIYKNADIYLVRKFNKSKEQKTCRI
jgi:intein-encoded DNA endonuclease-like protein